MNFLCVRLFFLQLALFVVCILTQLGLAFVNYVPFILAFEVEFVSYQDPFYFLNQALKNGYDFEILYLLCTHLYPYDLAYTLWKGLGQYLKPTDFLNPMLNDPVPIAVSSDQ